MHLSYTKQMLIHLINPLRFGPWLNHESCNWLVGLWLSARIGKENLISTTIMDYTLKHLKSSFFSQINTQLKIKISLKKLEQRKEVIDRRLCLNEKVCQNKNGDESFGGRCIVIFFCYLMLC